VLAVPVGLPLNGPGLLAQGLVPVLGPGGRNSSSREVQVHQEVDTALLLAGCPLQQGEQDQQEQVEADLTVPAPLLLGGPQG
jgi:hypothetical protein